MMEIKLNLGLVSIVDDEDYESASAFKWYAVKGGGGFYAARNALKSHPAMKLHRFILGAAPGTIVDHINGDSLDNRRSNLRFCTHMQNMANQKCRPNVSGYKGVSFYKANNKWGASVCVNGRRTFLGLFNDARDAATAYDAAAVAANGEFARTNFANAAVREKP